MEPMDGDEVSDSPSGVAARALRQSGRGNINQEKSYEHTTEYKGHRERAATVMEQFQQINAGLKSLWPV